MASNDASPWPTIATLAVLCGVALGALAILVIRLRRSQEPLFLDGGGLGDLELDALPMSQPAQVQPRSRGMLGPARAVPTARTLTVSTTPIVVLKAAGSRDWTVWARNVGPPGSFATFIIGADRGNAVTVPAGGFQMMRIPHGEFLYAIGDTPGVQVSVSGGQD